MKYPLAVTGNSVRNLLLPHIRMNPLISLALVRMVMDLALDMGIQEMLMQSHEGVIRLFPCWPTNQNARFGTLRASGAFLISAMLRDRRIGDILITSERGRSCTIVNPWPGRSVQVIRNGKTAETIDGERLTFPTEAQETIRLEVGL